MPCLRRQLDSVVVRLAHLWNGSCGFDSRMLTKPTSDMSERDKYEAEPGGEIDFIVVLNRA